MPPSNEIVSNRPLSGTELRQVMLNDLADILSKDGMFTEYIGYARVGYSITVKLHIDNPSYPEHTVHTQSKIAASNGPEMLKALEPPPLANTSPEALALGVERTREIDSPNHTRLEHKLPVTIMARDGNDGVMKERQVEYDTSKMDLEPGKVEDKDVSAQVQDEWGVE